ncbi:hypothetical protein TNCV_1625521 [Trichonephila clavipes]|nr:hypothetical protein TNCV_1625521 [Trichonephila clavipes]
MKEGLIASTYECPKCNDRHDVTWPAIKRFLRIRTSHAVDNKSNCTTSDIVHSQSQHHVGDSDFNQHFTLPERNAIRGIIARLNG